MEFEIAICDDCAADREFLIRQIKKNSRLRDRTGIHEYASGWEMLEAMKDIVFSAIFLDIQMEGLNGDETARAIREIDAGLVLVFYTGFAGPSPMSFEVQPYRYIMKNMPEEQIEGYMEAILKKMVENSEKPVIAANIGKTQVFIRAAHILYIEKYKRSLRIHITRQSYHIYGIVPAEGGECPDIRLQGRLEDIYIKLKKFGFGWPHDSYVVNCDYICYCNAKVLQLAETEIRFQITRSKAKAFREQKDRFFCSKYV